MNVTSLVRRCGGGGGYECPLLFGIFLPKLFREELQEPVGSTGLLWSVKVNNEGSIGFQHTIYFL